MADSETQSDDQNPGSGQERSIRDRLIIEITETQEMCAQVISALSLALPKANSDKDRQFIKEAIATAGRIDKACVDFLNEERDSPGSKSEEAYSELSGKFTEGRQFLYQLLHTEQKPRQERQNGQRLKDKLSATAAWAQHIPAKKIGLIIAGTLAAGFVTIAGLRSCSSGDTAPTDQNQTRAANVAPPATAPKTGPTIVPSAQPWNAYNSVMLFVNRGDKGHQVFSAPALYLLSQDPEMLKRTLTIGGQLGRVEPLESQDRMFLAYNPAWDSQTIILIPEDLLQNEDILNVIVQQVRDIVNDDIGKQSKMKKAAGLQIDGERTAYRITKTPGNQLWVRRDPGAKNVENDMVNIGIVDLPANLPVLDAQPK